MVNPAGSTSRTCRVGGLVDRMKVIRVSLGIARHIAGRAGALTGMFTPPGFTAPGDGRGVVCAAVAGPGPATAVPAVPVPATVLPQAASPIMRPAAMPPSVARVAASRGLPSVIIATPPAPPNLPPVPPGLPPPPAPPRPPRP